MSKADRLPGGKFTNTNLRARGPAGDKIGRDWAKWVKTWKAWLICSIWINEGFDYPEIELYMPARENYLPKAHSIILTDMTESEILSMQQLFNEMFELAIPICQARDRAAKEAYEAGEDADRRLYRAISSVFTRSWAVGIDSQSLLQRLELLPSSKRIAERRAEAARRARDDVAEDDPQDLSTAYDVPSSGEPEGLGEVRGQADPD